MRLLNTQDLDQQLQCAPRFLPRCLATMVVNALRGPLIVTLYMFGPASQSWLSWISGTMHSCFCTSNPTAILSFLRAVMQTALSEVGVRGYRQDSALRDAYWSLRAAADRAIEVAFKSSADAGPSTMLGVGFAMCS